MCVCWELVCKMPVSDVVANVNVSSVSIVTVCAF